MTVQPVAVLTVARKIRRRARHGRVGSRRRPACRPKRAEAHRVDPIRHALVAAADGVGNLEVHDVPVHVARFHQGARLAEGAVVVLQANLDARGDLMRPAQIPAHRVTAGRAAGGSRFVPVELPGGGGRSPACTGLDFLDPRTGNIATIVRRPILGQDAVVPGSEPDSRDT